MIVILMRTNGLTSRMLYSCPSLCLKKNERAVRYSMTQKL